MKLAKNRAYAGAGNAFSRALLVLENAKGKDLLVMPGDAEAAAAERFLAALSPRPVRPLRTQSQFVEFLAADAGFFVATADLFFRRVPASKDLAAYLRVIRPGDALGRDGLLSLLADSGWKFSRDGAPGTYRADGDTVAVFPPHGDTGWRVGFDGETVEGVWSFPADAAESLSAEKRFALPGRGDIPDWPAAPFSPKICAHFGEARVWLWGLDFFEWKDAVRAELADWVEFREVRDGDCPDLGVRDARFDDLLALRNDLAALAAEKGAAPKASRAVFFTKDAGAVRRFLDDNLLPAFPVLPLNLPPKGARNSADAGARPAPWLAPKGAGMPLRGTSFRDADRLVACDDLLGPLFIRKRRKSAPSPDLLLQIRPGDHVTHLHHGVGVFERIVQKELGGVAREYLEIRYAADGRLFVPVEEADRLSKYVGKDDPELHRLGGTEWTKSLAAAEDEALRVARELLERHAGRKLARAPKLYPFPDKEAAFHAAFPYAHTADQERSAAEILADLEGEAPMDRLLSGDVGFGKTEVAMHAAYRAFLNGAQTLVVSPLLVLAHEHADTFAKRLGGFGARCEVISRLTSAKDESRILKACKEGKVDVLIGTHRVLSPDVELPKLALVVVDEEHRLGVADKEKVSAKRAGCHALAMSATPIPRSLHLALAGVRKMSVIATAPWGRLPVQTVISPESDEAVARSLSRELERGGQAFVLSNKVETILPMRDRLARLLPKKVRIAVAHGQMPAHELEETVLSFKRREADVLLCSTVVENGVNFLDANTMVVLDADRFGLSQLHQLRGRVGRGGAQGYCHLFYRRDRLTEDARKRLSTLASLSHLGAGYEIALRDLEIRGAGEMLGLSQSGKTKEVGVGLYLRLLEEKVRELSGAAPKRAAPCQLDLPLSWRVPDEFFDGDADKVHFFRTLEGVADQAELEEAYESLLDGREAPAEARNLFLALKARMRLGEAGIRRLARSAGWWQFEFRPDAGAEGFRKFLAMDRRGLAVLSEARARIPERALPDAAGLLGYLCGEDRSGPVKLRPLHNPPGKA